MVKRLGGKRRHTRYKLARAPGDRGKIRITAFLKKYSVGDKVALVIDSAVARGMPHPRFHGKTGEVVGQQGTVYRVLITDINKEKEVLAHPVHLKHA